MKAGSDEKSLRPSYSILRVYLLCFECFFYAFLYSLSNLLTRKANIFAGLNDFIN